MLMHRIVSRKEWLAARQEFLEKEKAFTLQRDQLSQERRELPWMKIDTSYVFDTPTGQESLSDLFDGRSQLLVYHFMFGPDWEEGCPSCSFLADNFNGTDIHLKHRDVTLITVSKAPLETLEAYRSRMGWNFKWVSSVANDFNRDFHVSFSSDEIKKGEVYYNYQKSQQPSEELPGASVFYKDEEGTIFHTYSTYSRG
ncbi:MAG: thioredoxin family protein, partial [Nitrospirota bacterium]|nr:thioredoxin family protein [Nitrospirota bacterium]